MESQIIILGYYDNGTGKHKSNTVYSVVGMIPALTTINGGGTQQIKVLRNYGKASDRDRLCIKG